MKRFWIFVLMVIFPLTCFAEYQVVLKKTGKVIEGKFLREDDTTIYIIDKSGLHMNFKKELLDLEKMKELNPAQPEAPPSTQTQAQTMPGEEEGESSLAEAAKKAKEARKGQGRVYSDEDRSESGEGEITEGTEGGAAKGSSAGSGSFLRNKIATLQQKISEYENRIQLLADEGQSASIEERKLAEVKAQLEAAQEELAEAEKKPK